MIGQKLFQVKSKKIYKQNARKCHTMKIICFLRKEK